MTAWHDVIVFQSSSGMVERNVVQIMAMLDHFAINSRLDSALVFPHALVSQVATA